MRTISKNSVDMAISIAIGSVIGSVVALMIGRGLWWAGCVGAILGGAIGYISYDPLYVWRTVIESVREFNFRSWIIGVSNACLGLLGLVLVVLIIVALPLSLFASIALSLFISSISFGTGDILWMYSNVSTLGVVGIVICSVFAVACVALLDMHDDARQQYVVSRCIVAASLTPMFVVYSLPLFCVVAVCALFWEIAKIGKKVVIRICSAERLFVGAHSAFGASVGYATGNPLIGALVALIVATLLYEIVTERILGQKWI